jgi:hypothetical protein
MIELAIHMNTIHISDTIRLMEIEKSILAMIIRSRETE